MTVATLTVPVQIKIVEDQSPKAKIASFESVDQQFLALQSGRAQAMVVDLPLGIWYASQDENVNFIAELYSSYQNFSIAYKLGELEWAQFMNGWVNELKTGWLYPEYTEMYQKWFKVNPPPQRFYKIETPASATPQLAK